MMLMAGLNLPERALREQISAALDIIIQLSRLSDGSRKIVELSEVTGMEGPTITTQLIFRFNQTTIENGKVIGEFAATGVRPAFLERLERYGQKISPYSFNSMSLKKRVI
jgi:pilus assembly protein CpaF